jgi:hypothetical protein
VSYNTVTELVRKTEAAAYSASPTCPPDRMEDVPIYGLRQFSGLSKQDGTPVHEALAKSLEGRWVHQRFWPICKAARGWLQKQGISGILTETPLGAGGKIQGICDAMTQGGSRDLGLVEWKTCRQVPDVVVPANMCQLGLYGSLVSNPEHTWGAVGYISLTQRKIRFFTWDSLGECSVAARRLAA